MPSQTPPPIVEDAEKGPTATATTATPLTTETLVQTMAHQITEQARQKQPPEDVETTVTSAAPLPASSPLPDVCSRTVNLEVVYLAISPDVEMDISLVMVEAHTSSPPQPQPAHISSPTTPVPTASDFPSFRSATSTQGLCFCYSEGVFPSDAKQKNPA